MITRKGYNIKKSTLDDVELQQLKESLMVMPYVQEEFKGNIKPYPMYHEKEDSIIVPRYFGTKTYCKHGEHIKNNFHPNENNFEFLGELRPHQLEIANNVIEQIRHKGGGIVSLPCGAGKTVIALYLAHKLKVKTLVLVHKTFLQDQWIERAKSFTSAKLGIIRQSTIDIDNKDIVIGMIQSISMKEYDEKIFDQFGFVIVDECHHIASKVFSRALYKTGFKYTLGLSATLKRPDGLTKVIHWYLGDLLYSEERKQDKNVIVRKFNLQLNDPLFVEKMMWVKGKNVPALSTMITNFCSIKRRNQIILNTINVIRKDPKRKILVLSGRISHLEFLKTEIDKKIKEDEENGIIIKDECKTFYYIGKSKQTERHQAECESDILFASYEMAHEGLDIDRLNTIILATPKRNVVQAIGRIMRKILTTTDTKPLIVDFTDNISLFSNQGNVRYNLYKKNKYNIKEYVVGDKYIVSNEDYKNAKNNFIQEDRITTSLIFSETELCKNDPYHNNNSNIHKRLDASDYDYLLV